MTPRLPNPSGALSGIALAVLATLAAMTSAADARSLDEVMASRILRVAVYADNAPFSYRSGGALAGIDVDIARLFAKALDADLELMPVKAGDDVDADLRAHIWQGVSEERPLADVMLHTPIDRDLAARNREAIIAHPYFEQRIALAFDPVRLGSAPSFELFKRAAVAVEAGSISDYFVSFAYEGALRANIVHLKRLEEGVGRLAAGEVAGVLGVRSRLEAELARSGAKASFAELALPGIASPRWRIGLAVKEGSASLAEALGQALETLKATGALQAIAAKHGVGYVAPAGP